MALNCGGSMYVVICHARAQGLEKLLPHILLFATDTDTYDLATMMGLTSYDTSHVFPKMPLQAAEEYADETFRRFMLAKVYCVHLISQLGYDFLFQDVDVIWYVTSTK